MEYEHTPESLIASLHTLGWFEGMSPKRRQVVENRLRQADGLGDPESRAIALADFDFDTECIDGPGDYVPLIEAYAEAVEGFSITDITDTFHEEKATVSFNVGNTNYQVTVPFTSDWFDPDVAELVEQAAVAHGDGRSFELLPVLDQIAYVAFVNKSAVERALEQGILASFQDLADAQFR